MSRTARFAIAIALAVVPVGGCQPRKQMAVYTPPPEQPAPVAAADPPPVAPPAPDIAVGPAFTPHGLIFPPGWPVPPMPSTLPFPLPEGVPFPFPAPGGPSPSPSPSPSPTADIPAPAPTTPAPTPTPPSSTDGWPGASTALEDAVLAEVNARRAAGATCGSKAFGPAGPLAGHPSLRTSARLHSQDMGSKNYFDHTSLDGRQPQDRMKAAGWLGLGYTGENIAAGNATAKSTVAQWMSSTGHCENIMDPKFQYLGVGYFHAPSSKYRHYWTQNFAGQ